MEAGTMVTAVGYFALKWNRPCFHIGMRVEL
jgi:hypothetical protein